MISSDDRKPKLLEIFILVFFALTGLTWAWTLEIYDLQPAWGRVLSTIITATLSLTIMDLCLRSTRMPAKIRLLAAAFAITPWNGLLLSQTAYIGFHLLPLEVIASAIILKVRTPLSALRAFLLALIVRAVGFGIAYGTAAIIRMAITR